MNHSKSELFQLSALFAVSLSGTSAMPFIVMDIAATGIGAETASLLASLEIVGIALFNLLLTPGRMKIAVGVKTKRALILAALIAAEGASACLHTVAALAFLRFVAGMAEGALFSDLAGSAASVRHAEQLWGRITFLGGLSLSVLLCIISFLSTIDGSKAVFVSLAVFVLILSLVILIVPRAVTGTSAPNTAQVSVYNVPLSPVSHQRIGKLSVLLAIFLANAAQSSQWAVSAFRGSEASLSPEVTAWLLAGTSAAGMVGALVPSWNKGDRFRLPLLMASFTVLGISIYGFLAFPGEASFTAGQFFANAGFYSASPFLSGFLSELDVDGTLIRLALVAGLTGAAGGTAIAGPVFEARGSSDFGLLCASLVAASLLLSCWAYGQSGKPRTNLSASM